MTGYIHSFESLGALDGPGLRFVVFLSGCPLRCQYCHNPDTWNMSTGKELSADEIVKKVLRYRPYFTNGGGLTLSGGEPLMQPKFIMEIMQKCREVGISTCLDTSGSVFNEDVKEALLYADLVILDIKHTDEKRYNTLTGGNIAVNKAFLDYCRLMQKQLWIRQVILPGWNDTTEDMDYLLQYINGANIQRIELLPYHTMGIHKWEALGLPYQLKDIDPPSEEKMSNLRDGLVQLSTKYTLPAVRF